MIKIIKTKAIIDFNDEDYLKENACLVFDEKIIKITEFDKAIQEFQDAKIIDKSDKILCPVFCNLHAHLEFSLSLLDYGDFVLWLKSIIAKREKIDLELLNEAILEQIRVLQNSGVGYLGEISSFGGELKALSKSKIKSIVFHEILGSNPNDFRKNKEFFLKRFENCDTYKNAISLHSPYSICDDVYEFALEFAAKNKLLLSTHYAESRYELPYLAGEKNALFNYLQGFNPVPLSIEFLPRLKEINAIFTHCNYANLDDLDGQMITTCPRSNRYLGSKRLDISRVKKLSIGTDGLSSNDSLNFFDELKAGLFMYESDDLNSLATRLFKAACFDASHLFLGGKTPLSVGASSDFCLLDDVDYDKSQLILQIILRTKKINQMYLDGELV